VTEREFIEDVQEAVIGSVRAASLLVVAATRPQASAESGIAALPEHCAGISCTTARGRSSRFDVRADAGRSPGVAALLAPRGRRHD